MLETEMTKHVGGPTATSVVRDARVTATATRVLDTSSYHYHPSKRTSSVPSGLKRTRKSRRLQFISFASSDEIGRAAVKEGMVKMRADGLLMAARSITPIEEILPTMV